MENRFGVKDFFLFLILGLLVVIVLLQMKAYDRQWDVVQAVKADLSKQQEQIRDIHDRVLSGDGFVSATTTHPTAAVDAFKRLHAVQKMPDYAPGDAVVDNFPGGVAKLTPLLSGDAYAALVYDYVLESLAVRDKDTLEYTPLLCTDWTTEDHSKEYEAFKAQKKAAGATDEQIAADPACPSPVVITFTMRDGLRFSDGSPLTADDVVFTFDFTMNPKVNAPRSRSGLSKVRKVVKVGTNQVAFYFNEPYFLAFDLASGIAILPKSFYGGMTVEEFNQSVGYLMGSGPYRLSEPKTWKPGTAISLVRNEQYWGVRPPLDKLDFTEIGLDAARLTAFRNGDLDVYAATPDQYVRMIKDDALVARTQHLEYLSPRGGYRYVAWNEMRDGKPTRFADKRVRQAMTMLVDRQKMMDVCALGYAVAATGPFSPVSKQCNPDVKPWPFDIARAKQLLAEAGFGKTNDQGLLVGPDDQPFRFKLTYPSGNASYDKMILFLKDAYTPAGIELVPDPLPWAVFTDRLNNRNFDTISLGWTSGIENDIYQMFDSANSGPGGDDFTSYKNPELDRCVEKARTTVDESARMPLWRQAHAILHEDQPYMFLWYGKNLVFTDKRVRNVRVTKMGLNDRTEWYVPAAEQQRKK